MGGLYKPRTHHNNRHHPICALPAEEEGTTAKARALPSKRPGGRRIHTPTAHKNLHTHIYIYIHHTYG